MKRIIVFTIFCLLILPQFVVCETLTVSYLERVPYYYTEQGHAAGFLIELSEKIFQEAGVEVFFIETPPNRIILEIKKTENFYCSIGWFKNPDRENFAKFSLPIYQNKPVVILTNKKQRHLFSPYKTLKEVFSDKSLIMATMSAFSYGTFIDKLMKDDFPKTHEISSKQELLPTLIMSGRVAYMLIAPEEIEALVRSPGLNPADFVSVTMSDIPTGNKRYLMFSKGVSDGIIERINLSVRKFVNPDIFEKGSENFYPEKSTN